MKHIIIGLLILILAPIEYFLITKFIGIYGFDKLVILIPAFIQGIVGLSIIENARY